MLEPTRVHKTKKKTINQRFPWAERERRDDDTKYMAKEKHENLLVVIRLKLNQCDLFLFQKYMHIPQHITLIQISVLRFFRLYKPSSI